MTGDIDITFESTGADLRTLLGNANGIVFADLRGGQMGKNRFLQALYGDVLDELLSAINPFSKTDPVTNLECIVIPLEIADGQVQSSPASFVSTDKVRITITPSLDLKTEKIDVQINTTPRKALGVSAGELVNPYIKVIGTLAAPRLAVNQKGLLVSGGTAVATGGISLLAKAAWDRLSRAGDPCKNATEQGQQALGDRFPDFAGLPRAGVGVPPG